MNPIPLPTGIRGDASTPKQQEFLINAYLEAGDVPTLSSRPGIADKGAIYGRTRGQEFFNGAVYRVSSDKVFKLALNAAGDILTTELVGTITGANDCELVASFNYLFIMVIDGDAFAIDTADTITQVVSPNYLPARDVEFLDGRYVSVPYDGSPIQWSDLGDPLTWPAENFADAEEQPDKNLHIIELSGSLIVGGEKTIERLSYDGQKATYVNTTNAATNHGVVCDFARFGEQLVYIGKYNNGTMSVYQYGKEQPISDKGVDEFLNKYTVNQLQDIQVDAFSWKGQNMVVWRLPEESLYFYGDFGFIKTGVSGDASGNWVGQYIASLEGRLLCGDNKSNRIGELQGINSDYGEKVESRIRTFIRGTARDNFLIGRIVMAAGTALSNEQKDVALAISEDGVTNYSNKVWTSLGVAGQYAQEVSWGQIGRFDNFCGIELSWACDISVPVDGVYFE